MAGLMFPKGRPAALEREDRRKARKSLDEKESDKVKARSKGQCECTETYAVDIGDERCVHFQSRCKRKARHVHHKLGGNGVRGRGASALAKNKLHLCAQCHRDIHAHVLIPDGKYFKRLT